MRFDHISDHKHGLIRTSGGLKELLELQKVQIYELSLKSQFCLIAICMAVLMERIVFTRKEG